MPKVLCLYRVFDDPYSYSSGVFYTILPDDVEFELLPKQKEFLSSGINKGCYYSSLDAAKKEILRDIKNGIFSKPEFDTMTYYIITVLETEWDDLFYADSDPPDYTVEDMYIVKNDQLVKLIDDESTDLPSWMVD